MVKVILTPFARDDAKSLFFYHYSFSQSAAQTLREEIIIAARRLLLFPEMGPLEPSLEHLGRNFRYVLVQRRYKLIYLYENENLSGTDRG
jgi:plasmid stabilization system protein ParE